MLRRVKRGRGLQDRDPLPDGVDAASANGKASREERERVAGDARPPHPSPVPPTRRLSRQRAATLVSSGSMREGHRHMFNDTMLSGRNMSDSVGAQNENTRPRALVLCCMIASASLQTASVAGTPVPVVGASFSKRCWYARPGCRREFQQTLLVRPPRL